jgi:hypothetical protein
MTKQNISSIVTKNFLLNNNIDEWSTAILKGITLRNEY